MKKTLSVVLAVYNEEDYLKECLESVKDLAWEIVLVDGGSEDKTLEIAQEFHAKVIKTNNPPNFHINKNKAIDAAKGDWILQLDADEIVTKELADEIKKIITIDFSIDGYWIPRRNFFLGRFLKKGGQYPDYTLRLYRRGRGRLPAKDVHEQAKVLGETGFINNDLLHIRDKEFFIYLERFNRYTNLFSTQLKESGVGINPLSFLDYLLLKSFFWFLRAYIRHRGYEDGFPGFVFALFSALRFPISYIKLWANYERKVS